MGEFRPWSLILKPTSRFFEDTRYTFDVRSQFVQVLSECCYTLDIWILSRDLKQSLLQSSRSIQQTEFGFGLIGSWENYIIWYSFKKKIYITNKRKESKIPVLMIARMLTVHQFAIRTRNFLFLEWGRTWLNKSHAIMRAIQYGESPVWLLVSRSLGLGRPLLSAYGFMYSLEYSPTHSTNQSTLF